MAGKEQYATDDEMSMLTDEERASLEETDDNGNDDQGKPQDGDADAAGDGAGKPNAESASDGGKPKDAAAGPGEGEGEGEAEGNDEGAGDGDGEEGEISAEALQGVLESATQPAHSTFAPRMEAAKVEDYETKQKELTDKFETGDITLAEYNVQRDALLEARIKSNIAEDFNVRVGEQVWRHEQDLFFSQQDHSHYRQNPVLMAALGAAVNQIRADEKNSGKTGLVVLAEAHKLVAAQLAPATQDKGGDDPQKGGKGGGDGKDAQPPKRQGKKTEAPKTLGGLPAASHEQPNTDEFAHIDKLEGDELEEALARMTPAEQQRYLHS